MTTDFGDYEPEDAWHPDDTVAEQLRNLIARAELLDRRQLRFGSDDPHDILDALATIVAAARRRRLDPRDVLRVRDLEEDIFFIRGRL